MFRKEEALEYHSRGRKGKIEVNPTKPCRTQADLSLAYTPGVAEPSRAIAKNPDLVYDYTAKGNLVAVVSNGTAVLGLGNIGPLGAKPVMEGKAVLFKRFADIDAFDLELDTLDADEIIRIVKALEPTLGGVNLEDIKAPECFYIEETLKKQMDIPVFHDDQHGTAIISGAGLLNALELRGHDIRDVKVVINGAGAAGIAVADFYCLLGVRRQNIWLCDTHGLVYGGRKEGMNPYKERYAQESGPATLADVMKGAHVFVGLSVGNCVTEEMAKTMAKKPIIFAMANPDPEIPYDAAKRARPDAIIATGRSDYPNQVNNVLGFPYIFRGALDVRATKINEEMKVAASHALANLTRETVPEYVAKAYGQEEFEFGPDYIIPKPFDQRVLVWEAAAVAEAAMKTGVARRPVDLEEYRDTLTARLGRTQEVMRVIIEQARRKPKRIVFPEGHAKTVLRAAQELLDEETAIPVLIGNPEIIRERAAESHCPLEGAEIVNSEDSEWLDEFASEIFELRHRRGVTLREARELAAQPNYFGAMMVRTGKADGLVSGVTQHYPDALRPCFQLLRGDKAMDKVSGVFIMVLRDRVLFFVDTTVNIAPTPEDLANFAEQGARLAEKFRIKPRVALLSFSNFGSVRDPEVETVRKALEILRKRCPDLIVDGEMQADTALVPEILEADYPFSAIRGSPANVLVFPNLSAGNIGYKLVQRLGEADAIGPILLGMGKPVHIAPRGCEVSTVVNLAALAVIDAQESEAKKGGA
jgi:malate dehydrogenase (oxaloacetate-decarboxylating)(NADP+)